MSNDIDLAGPEYSRRDLVEFTHPVYDTATTLGEVRKVRETHAVIVPYSDDIGYRVDHDDVHELVYERS